jgi:hypothetical protein
LNEQWKGIEVPGGKLVERSAGSLGIITMPQAADENPFSNAPSQSGILQAGQ